MPRVDKAKVFMTGRSQAVRIPAEFRFSGSEVYIRRDPKNGNVILSEGPASLKEIFDALDALEVPEEFLSVEARLQPAVEDRDEL
jgi:antitoxin VapB